MEMYGPVLHAQLPELISERWGVHVSESTAVNYLHNAGLRSYAAQLQPPIPPGSENAHLRSAENIKARLGQTLFVDECTVGQTHTASSRYWGTRPRLFFHLAIPPGLRSNAVGAVSAHGVLPLEFPAGPTLNGKRFAACLDQMLGKKLIKEWGIKHIVLDNARIHNVPEVQEVLLNHGITRIPIPPYSPDLNAIEHVWGRLKQAVNKKHGLDHFKTIKDLDKATNELWGTFDVRKSVKSFGDTLDEIIKKKGEYTGA